MQRHENKLTAAADLSWKKTNSISNAAAWKQTLSFAELTKVQDDKNQQEVNNPRLYIKI